jgi:hypothetical protein
VGFEGGEMFVLMAIFVARFSEMKAVESFLVDTQKGVGVLYLLL